MMLVTSKEGAVVAGPAILDPIGDKGLKAGFR